MASDDEGGGGGGGGGGGDDAPPAAGAVALGEEGRREEAAAGGGPGSGPGSGAKDEGGGGASSASRGSVAAKGDAETSAAGEGENSEGTAKASEVGAGAQADAVPAAAADDDDDDDDDDLARMMAIQEEEHEDEDEDASDAATDAAVADFGAREGGGDGGGGEEEEEVGAGGAPPPAPRHPNLDNPAAVALRRRRALRDAALRDADAAAALRDERRPLPLRVLRSLLPAPRYTTASLLAAFLLVHRALRTRQQFYLALAYLRSSKLAYILLGNAVVALAAASFGFFSRTFLEGGLRPNERDAIGERVRWDVTETCLALTIFRSELDAGTAVRFLGLVLMKCLHWSVELRGGHLRMTEEAFVYPEEDPANDNAPADGGADAAGNDRSVVRPLKPWYRRLPRPRLSHVRFHLLVDLLLVADILAVAHCALSVATSGPSVDILFGFEAAILLVAGLSCLGTYHLHVIDGIVGALQHLAEGEHHHVPLGGMAEQPEGAAAEGGGGGGGGDGEAAAADAGAIHEHLGERVRGEAAADDAGAPDAPAAGRPPPANPFAKMLVDRIAEPWRDRRATLSFAIELQAQAAKFLFYVVFFAIVFTYYGMPINIFREVYVSFQQLRRRLVAFNTYRRLTHDMDRRFEPIRDEEELDRLGHTCIICRDAMDLSGGCVKLPGCGHAFHAHCLREWLVQQQTCPTCRADIAANEARRKRRAERERAAAAAQAATEAAAAAQGGGDAAAPREENAAMAAESNATRPTTDGQATEDGAEGVRQSQQAAATPAPDDANTTLPEGWTRHVDARSGSSYYHNGGLGLSSWEPPVASNAPPSSPSKEPEGAAAVVTRASDVKLPAPFSANVGVNSDDSLPKPIQRPSFDVFPCLCRVTSPLGAPVYSPSHSPGNAGIAVSSPTPPQSIAPRGKLVVGTAVETWPAPFGQSMLRTPGGYVRCVDVEGFLEMSTPRAGGGGVAMTYRK
ncbi:hypothetical protein ACHAWF_013576 [Thalassiosira exigua]